MFGFGRPNKIDKLENEIKKLERSLRIAIREVERDVAAVRRGTETRHVLGYGRGFLSSEPTYLSVRELVGMIVEHLGVDVVHTGASTTLRVREQEKKP